MASVSHSTARAMAHAPTHTPNRRALLGGLAVAPFAAPAQAAHPDAKLIELERRRAQVHAAYDAANRRTDSLGKACQVEAPEAIFLREEDYALGLDGFAHRRSDGRHWYWAWETSYGGRLRQPIYRSQDYAGESLALPAGDGVTGRVLWPEAQARADEIVAAFDLWRKQIDEASHASGHAAAFEEEKRLGGELNLLEREIEQTTACTLDGLGIKAEHLQRLFDNGMEDEAFGEFFAEVVLFAKSSDLASLALCDAANRTVC